MSRTINILLTYTAVIFTVAIIPQIVEIIITKIKERNKTKAEPPIYQKEEPIQIHKDYASIKGEIGEHETYLKIKGLDAEFEKFLFNIYIPTGINQWTEIDIIYISRFGVFVIENKNYSGWIYGSEKGKIWTVAYNKNSKQTLYNPILQNQKHVLKVKEILYEKRLNSNIVKSIICFNDKAVLKQVPQSNDNVKIINSRSLRQTITETGELKLNETEINEIYQALKIYENASEEVKQQHIRNIKGNHARYYYRNKKPRRQRRYYKKRTNNIIYFRKK